MNTELLTNGLLTAEEIEGHILINREGDETELCGLFECCNGLDCNGDINGCGDELCTSENVFDHTEYNRPLYLNTRSGVWVWVAYPDYEDYEDSILAGCIQGD